MENKFKPTIHQSDERTFFLSRMLLGVTYARPTHIFAPNIKMTGETIQSIESGSNLICGKCDESLSSLAKAKDIAVFNMLSDEQFQAVNSRLTAEGALMLMMQHSKKSIADANTLILGFGRTGAAVAKIFSCLGVSLDIATKNSLRPAYAFANNVIPLTGFDFAPYDIIVNSVPAPIVSDIELMSMAQDTVYIDLASTPAINLDYAHYLGIDADIYPALPAKVSPYSAAKAMHDYISKVIS